MSAVASLEPYPTTCRLSCRGLYIVMIYVAVTAMQMKKRQSTLSPASSWIATMLTIKPRIMHCFLPSTVISRFQSERVDIDGVKFVTMGGGIGFVVG